MSGCNCGCNGAPNGCGSDAALVLYGFAEGGAASPPPAPLCERRPAKPSTSSSSSSSSTSPPTPNAPTPPAKGPGWSARLARDTTAPYGSLAAPPTPPAGYGVPAAGDPTAIERLGIDGATFRNLPTEAQVQILTRAIEEPARRQQAINDLVLGSIDRVFRLINDLDQRGLERFREETRRISQQYEFLLRREQQFYEAWLRAQGLPPSQTIPSPVPFSRDPQVQPQPNALPWVIGGAVALAAVAAVALAR